MSKLFINCRQATYLHEQKKEGKLSLAERFGLWLHLLYCGICRLFVKQVEEVEQACGKVAASEKAQMPEAAKQRLTSELQKQMQ
jgi:hypothetical protein